MNHDHGFSPEELDRGINYLHKLKNKYEGIGQDFFDYLEGLVESHGLYYWDYIHLNSLLGLQSPRTRHPDEMIFIVYHQITELYFKLIKHEMMQLTDPRLGERNQLQFWKLRVGRIGNYFKHLCQSLDIMHGGMEFDQFRKFRMALLPASGFQSVQFREIEIMSTPLPQLLHREVGPEADSWSVEEAYEHMYWKRGGIQLDSGQKTLTLREFEEHYDTRLIKLIREYADRNLYTLYLQLPEALRNDEELREKLRFYDEHLNVFWRLSHLASAARYLPPDVEGTGGTNWRQYLPPRFQGIRFFESLWSEEEKAEWGKAGVQRFLFS
jgi:tryptophan 2,3-dioxygenase